MEFQRKPIIFFLSLIYDFNNLDSLEPHADLEGEAPDGSFANRNGRHAIGHVDDYSALLQQVLEGKGLVQRMEAALQACLNMALLEASTGKVAHPEMYPSELTLANISDGRGEDIRAVRASMIPLK